MVNGLVRDGLVWGGLLWLLGYGLSFVLFFFVPMALLGWVVTPFALAVTVWVCFKKLRGSSLAHYAAVGVLWTLIAIGLDYSFIVKLLKPADGYYKLDVYLYYVLMLIVPVGIGWWKLRRE